MNSRIIQEILDHLEEKLSLPSNAVRTITAAKKPTGDFRSSIPSVDASPEVTAKVVSRALDDVNRTLNKACVGKLNPRAKNSVDVLKLEPTDADKESGCEPIGIRIETNERLLSHLVERMNDPRNLEYSDVQQISDKKIKDFMLASIRKHYDAIRVYGDKGVEVVLYSTKSNINIPIIIRHNKTTDTYSITLKTTMVKKDFKTTSPKLAISESLENLRMKLYSTK